MAAEYGRIEIFKTLMEKYNANLMIKNKVMAAEKMDVIINYRMENCLFITLAERLR